MFCCFPHALSFKRSASCCTSALVLFLSLAHFCSLARQLSFFFFTFSFPRFYLYASQRRLILFIYPDVFADRHCHCHSVWRSGCITNQPSLSLYAPGPFAQLGFIKVGAHDLLGVSDYLKPFEHRLLCSSFAIIYPVIPLKIPYLTLSL